jgi:hypothetical protein
MTGRPTHWCVHADNKAARTHNKPTRFILLIYVRPTPSVKPQRLDFAGYNLYS